MEVGFQMLFTKIIPDYFSLSRYPCQGSFNSIPFSEGMKENFKKNNLFALFVRNRSQESNLSREIHG